LRNAPQGGWTVVVEVYERHARLDRKVYMTLDEAIGLSQALAGRARALAPAAELVVGLANGAVMPTRIVATALGIPFHMVKVRRQGSRLKQRLSAAKRLLRLPPGLLRHPLVNAVSLAFDRRFGRIEDAGGALDFAVAGRTVLVIDDCIDSGASIAHVRDRLTAAGAARVQIAVLCWSNKQDTEARHGVVPDVHLHRRIQYYPWSINSPHYAAFVAWLDAAGLSLWR
jgi:hypoxanthine phosphoribosyltransferase